MIQEENNFLTSDLPPPPRKKKRGGSVPAQTTTFHLVKKFRNPISLQAVPDFLGTEFHSGTAVVGPK